MKKEYEPPKIVIERIKVDDVITASGELQLFNPEDIDLEKGTPWYGD